MTLEEMKDELEANGYTVSKKERGEIWTKEVWSKLKLNYLYSKPAYSKLNYVQQCNADRNVRNFIRRWTLDKFEYKNYGSIPEEKRQEVIEFMLAIGKEYIDWKEERNWKSLRLVEVL